jgi:glycosyltransferase involved in cell wall biosynthesis
MIRIHFTYRHIDAPWGGANNFIRALHHYLREIGTFEMVPSLYEPCDILFMNQLGAGPGAKGAMHSLHNIKCLLKLDSQKRRRRKLIVRAVNLNWHAFPIGLRNLTRGWWIDRQTLGLLNMADMAIFQSEYQRAFFEHSGYQGKNSIIIHNGAANEYWRDLAQPPVLECRIRLISSTASPRATKRHDLIAKFSLHDDVEVLHLGAWPKGLDSGRVRLLGMLSRDEMMKVFADCHYFLHPAIKDPCPNSIFEAICSGLPVIYNPAIGSSREIVGHCGIPLDEADLSRTINAAREQFIMLRNIVIEKRDNYTITRAASEYRTLFERLAYDQ